jgi:ABC-type multidrug transport system permease subunit
MCSWAVILVAAFVLFEVPMEGSFVLLMAMIGVFIVANLGVGFTFSTIARNQLQAMQMTIFLLSAVYFAVGLYVPVSKRHARVGAAHWRDFAADAFCAHRAGHFAEGQYSSAGVA